MAICWPICLSLPLFFVAMHRAHQFVSLALPSYILLDNDEIFEIGLWNHLPEALNAFEFEFQFAILFSIRWCCMHVCKAVFWDASALEHSYVFFSFSELRDWKTDIHTRKYKCTLNTCDYLLKGNVYRIEIITHNNITISAIWCMQRAKVRVKEENNTRMCSKNFILCLHHAMFSLFNFNAHRTWIWVWCAHSQHCCKQTNGNRKQKEKEQSLKLCFWRWMKM